MSIRSITTKAALGVACAGIALAAATGTANASPLAGLGCETVHWGFLGSQRRTICDGPRQADGSWLRGRVVWVPAHYVPARSYCGSYSCSYSGGYYVDESVVAQERYVVFDHNVVAGEPGWLPAGSDVIR